MRAVGLAICAALGCGVPTGVLTPETAARLDVHPVDWNPRREAITDVTGVLDLGSDVVVFSHGSTAVLADGVATVEKRELRAGAVIPAPDGSGSWITGLDDHGRVLRLRARRTFEPVSDRYGLDGKDVHALAGFGGRYVAFVLGAGDVALADGGSVTHFDLRGGGPGLGAVVGTLEGAGVRTWVASAHELVAFDPHAHTSRTYAVEEPLVAVDSGGHVVVASKRAVYEARAGKLVLRYVAQNDVSALAASSDRVWFVDGNELGVVTESGVSRTRAARLPPGTRLVGSQSGDVWTLDARGALARWGVGPAVARGGRGAWSDVVAPIFSRACAGCHAEGGPAGVDLSKEGAWKTKRDLLRQRVLTDHDMPPEGHALSDADRAALRAWLDNREAQLPSR